MDIKEAIRAVEAVHKDAKEKGLKKAHGGTAEMKCPICVDGTIHYSVASCNGHIYAGCSTQYCIRFME